MDTPTWPGLPMMIQITTNHDQRPVVKATYDPDSIMALEPGVFVITLELHQVKESSEPNAKRYGVALATIWEMKPPAPANPTTQEETK
ncbi:MAG: hypothetical protein GEU28_13180 [Dehalococcoidia bacterium]|nr:hypothetical protein [Dehalococcoidia bacterium]